MIFDEQNDKNNKFAENVEKNDSILLENMTLSEIEA